MAGLRAMDASLRCFCLTHVPRVTHPDSLSGPKTPERSLVPAFPRPSYSLATDKTTVARVIPPSLFRHWQSEADRRPSSVVSQDSCCERVGKGYRVCFATKKASLEIKKKKKSALICAKVTFLCVKSACGRAAQREESVLRGAGASRSSPASPGCASARSPGTPGSGRPRCSPRTLGRQKRG